MHSLRNRRILVIGGSSGIGLAIASATAGAGASVTIASRNQEKLTEAATKLSGTVHTAVLDTGDNGLLERFFEKQMTWDHVVVSAAQTRVGSVRSLSLTDANVAMESKFWGAYRVARVARINDGGSLTLLSGFLSERPSATAVLQGSINAALEALARGLALELAPVRVNAVSPGMIETPIWDDLPPEQRRGMFETTAAQLPVRKIGQPEDVADAVLFLMTTGNWVHCSSRRRRGHRVSLRDTHDDRAPNELRAYGENSVSGSGSADVAHIFYAGTRGAARRPMTFL